MPVTKLGSFVVVETQVRAQLNFVQPIKVQPEINRRVVSRITADNDQRIDSAGVNVGNQFAQRLSLIDWVGFDWIGEENCLANIAEGGVYCMGQRVDDWGLFVTHDDETLPFVFEEIASNGIDQAVVWLKNRGRWD